MNRLRTTLALARSSVSVLRADPELLVLPVLSAIATSMVAASSLLPLVLTGGAGSDPTPVGDALLFVIYLVLAFIVVFFNAALVAGAYERLRGGDPTIGSALRAATSRIGRILPWAIVSATVSVVLDAIQQRAGTAGRVIAGVVGGVAIGIVIAVGVVWLLAVTLIMTSLSAAFQTARYLHAAGQPLVGSGFDPTLIERSFGPPGTARA